MEENKITPTEEQIAEMNKQKIEQQKAWSIDMAARISTTANIKSAEELIDTAEKIREYVIGK